MAAALIVAGVCVLLGLTVRAIQHRTRHTHMRPIRYHDDTAWRAFNQSMRRHTKEHQ